jgi:O-methyltransferase
LTEVASYLTAMETDWRRTTLVEGYFEKSLTEETRRALQLDRCAVAVIDCDLYRSTVPVLEFLRPLLQRQSVLLFDGWRSCGEDPTRGELRAFAEFLQTYPELEAEPFFRFGKDGQGFFVTRG